MSNKWILMAVFRRVSAFMGLEVALTTIAVMFFASAILLMCLSLIRMKESVDANLESLGICQAQIEYFKDDSAMSQASKIVKRDFEYSVTPEKIEIAAVTKSQLITQLKTPDVNTDLSEVNATHVQAKNVGAAAHSLSQDLHASIPS